ncbi:hypothetical protein [Nocardia terpenica]|uniref:Uncharacterized protein n=1 Tax=Nocardia terpenica TaxID=455432 RepID=A0A164N0V9_9NOCA|nr:hypothetical protein [Nocardia terpenica]ATL66835.1 hypothetical protein CRH09_12050 [Nocardia terpenica]KZM73863.1 hypothetical protein AWN90_35595 [Nocardia terpenica]MBF6064610.1 hypothetical protein [Nocardia terpenica]MBF6106766.1 hypothetical protein [Nocardia terpenica]MBF6114578.1 hypothetical protein [Nocardia terpenica]
MRGKVLDIVLLVAWAILFVAVANFAPGVGVALIAWGGIAVLGYYNSFVRHDRALDLGHPALGRRVNHDETLRPAWR